MVKFYLKVSDLNNNLTNYRKNKKNIQQSLELCFSVFSNLDYAWNSSKEKKFRSILRKDSQKLKNYFDSLDKLYQELENFKADISRIASRYNYYNVNSINYTNSRVQTCINYIAQARDDLNTALNYMAKKIVYPSDFKELDMVNEVLHRLSSVRNTIDCYDNDVCNFSNSILKSYYDFRGKKAKLGNYDFDFKELVYSWSNSHLDLRKYSKIKNIESSFKYKKIESKKEKYDGSNIKNTNIGPYADFDLYNSKEDQHVNNIKVSSAEPYADFDLHNSKENQYVNNIKVSSAEPYADFSSNNSETMKQNDSVLNDISDINNNSKEVEVYKSSDFEKQNNDNFNMENDNVEIENVKSQEEVEQHNIDIDSIKLNVENEEAVTTEREPIKLDDDNFHIALENEISK